MKKRHFIIVDQDVNKAPGDAQQWAKVQDLETGLQLARAWRTTLGPFVRTEDDPSQFIAFDDLFENSVRAFLIDF